MPLPPHLLAARAGRNLYNQRGAAANANSGGVHNFDKIRCGICKHTKPTADYAKRQQQKHADSISNPYAPGGRSVKAYATCRDCTAKQVTELHCMVCNNTMNVKYFNRTQRHDPDHARCRKCVQVNEDRLAGIDPTFVDSDDYTDASESDWDIDGEEDFNKDLPPLPKKAPVAVAMPPLPKNAPVELSNESESEDDSEGDIDQRTQKAPAKAASKKGPAALATVAVSPSVGSSGTATPAYSGRASAAARTGITTPNTGSKGMSYAAMVTESTTSLPVNSGSNDDGEWQTVPNPRKNRKGNAFTAKGSAWNSGAQTPVSATVKKGGWAKTPKLKKDETPPFFGGSQAPSSPAFHPIGGQPSMVTKKQKSAKKKELLASDSDDDYDA